MTNVVLMVRPTEGPAVLQPPDIHVATNSLNSMDETSLLILQEPQKHPMTLEPLNYFKSPLSRYSSRQRPPQSSVATSSQMLKQSTGHVKPWGVHSPES
ncbi:hypothetical protein VZT92_013765 [Zoarces viviparus]|uniref:Uncharacterized protein n=1 Tax=Zoarces viviparus TaxID=48416 RepID=A0AAW1F568_ZOAVI